MGKTQHQRSRTRYETTPESAYDEYVQRVDETKRVRRKKKVSSNTPAPTNETFQEAPWADWERDCYRWRGMLLEGRYAHWCAVWNSLPMDETCPEWPCGCNIVHEVDRVS